jgi:PAS domain-containing protein
MSHPSDLIDPMRGAPHPASLRGRAASRLAGPAADKGAPARAADALGVLHLLASSPATAADALTLLHELQVHQVEVELQAQELQESRAELEAALRRQTELYDFQPVGCFTVDAATVVHELNRTGAEWLRLGRDEGCGLPLEAFLDTDSAQRLRAALASVAAGLPRATCPLTLRADGPPTGALLGSIAKDPAADRFLVVLSGAPGPRDR